MDIHSREDLLLDVPESPRNPVPASQLGAAPLQFPESLRRELDREERETLLIRLMLGAQALAQETLATEHDLVIDTTGLLRRSRELLGLLGQLRALALRSGREADLRAFESWQRHPDLAASRWRENPTEKGGSARDSSAAAPAASAAGGAAPHGEQREWVIERCVGTSSSGELLYRHFPTADGLMTRTQMMKALESCARVFPDFEFRGHRVQKGGAR